MNKYDTVVGEAQQFSSNLMALGSVLGGHHAKFQFIPMKNGLDI